MAKDLILCRVRPGAVLAHQGREYVGGEEVTLERRVAGEVPHLVDEVIGSDKVRRIGAPDAVDRVQAQLATHRPHERLSLLQEARADLVRQLEALDRLIAGEQATPPAVVDARAGKITEPAAKAESADKKK